MWWTQTSTLDCWLDDFLRDALLRRGLGDALAGGTLTTSGLLSSPRDYGFSSLDMLSLASRFASCLGMDRTGLADLLLARRSAEGWLNVAQRSLGIDDKELAFYSSGSTGNPTASKHALRLLQREAASFQNLLPPTSRVVCLVPYHHIYGFIWGILLPEALGAPSIRINPAVTLPSSWCSSLQENDLIVATPELWSMIAALRPVLPSRFVGVSSTSPLAPATAESVNTLYPGASLIEVYGSSETAGIAWRQKPVDPFHLLPYWALQQQTDVWTLKDREHGTEHVLNDRLHAHDNNSFDVLGRRDDVVQIGGHNIDLTRLAQRLCTHPDIHEASARAEKQDDAVVLHYFLALQNRPSEPARWCESFSQWLTDNLGDVAPPASVVLGTELPRSALGKKRAWNSSDYQLCHGIYRLT